MLAEMTRYRVFVVSLKPKRGFKQQGDDAVFVNEGDTFLGYGYTHHREGKYFDLWFTNPKEKDLENFMTFGRIQRRDGGIYYTKLGVFTVEDMDDTSKRKVSCGFTGKGVSEKFARSQGHPQGALPNKKRGSHRPEAFSVRMGNGTSIHFRCEGRNS